MNTADSSSSEDSSDEDEDSPPEELVDGKSDAETWFNDQNTCVKVLVAMCHGISDKDGSPLLDIDVSPWKEMNEDSSKQ
jgi:hypothetical protein